MIPYYCGRCGALDEKGAQAHRCAKVVGNTLYVSNDAVATKPVIN